MIKKLATHLIIILVSFLAACSISTKEKPPGIKCKLNSSKIIELPASKIKTNFAVLDIRYKLKAKPNTDLSSAIKNDYEKIIYLPKDLRANIDGKSYIVGVKKRYKTTVEVKTINKPQSEIIGNPKELKEAKETIITEDSFKLIEKYRTLSSGCKVYLFPKLKKHLKILEFPDKSSALRNFDVSEIRIKEMYLKIGNSVHLDAEIKGDSLLLLY